MNTSFLRRLFLASVFLLLLTGCVASEYGADYYETSGGYYGYWGPGYYVGPYGRGGHPGHPEAGHRAPAYRPAPASHPMPSIPSGARSGRR